MGAKKHIKLAMTDKNIKSSEVAEALKIDKIQAFYNKVNRDTMSFKDAEKIANALGCDIVFIDRETKKMY